MEKVKVTSEEVVLLNPHPPFCKFVSKHLALLICSAYPAGGKGCCWQWAPINWISISPTMAPEGQPPPGRITAILYSSAILCNILSKLHKIAIFWLLRNSLTTAPKVQYYAKCFILLLCKNLSCILHILAILYFAILSITYNSFLGAAPILTPPLTFSACSLGR